MPVEEKSCISSFSGNDENSSARFPSELTVCLCCFSCVSSATSLVKVRKVRPELAAKLAVFSRLCFVKCRNPDISAAVEPAYHNMHWSSHSQPLPYVTLINTRLILSASCPVYFHISSSISRASQRGWCQYLWREVI